MNELELAAAEDYASLNITYNGQQGNLPDPIAFDASNEDILAMAQEAIRAGGVPGITADPRAVLTDFIVKPYAARDGLPNRIVIRPSTPFGG